MPLRLPSACFSLLILASSCGRGGDSATASTTPNAEAPTKRLALEHVTVVNVLDGSLQADRTIVIDGDHIASIVAGGAPTTAGSRTIDMRGKFVIPGLWDMHVHFSDPASGKLFVANGVTGVRVMWGNPNFAPGMERFHFRLRDAFDKAEDVGPRMVIASQILDGPKPVWPNSVALSTPDDGRKAVVDAKASGVDFIKVYSRLPRDVYFAIASESKRQGLPFEGHVPAAITVAEASDAGQKSVEHLTGLLTACSSRETELRSAQRDFAMTERTGAEWSKFRARQTAEAIGSYDPAHARNLFAKLTANGTWQCPTLTLLQSMANLDDPSLTKDPRMQYVSAFVRKTWDPKSDFRTKNRTAEDYAALRAELSADFDVVGEMNRSGVPILAGTDEVNPFCFAGFSLHDELRALVKAGLTPTEALRTATSNPARFFGWEAKLGSVAEGKLADLVILDADPLADIGNAQKIAAVVSRGTFRDRAALDGLLQEAKESAEHPQWGPGGFAYDHD